MTPESILSLATPVMVVVALLFIRRAADLFPYTAGTDLAVTLAGLDAAIGITVDTGISVPVFGHELSAYQFAFFLSVVGVVALAMGVIGEKRIARSLGPHGAFAGAWSSVSSLSRWTRLNAYGGALFGWTGAGLTLVGNVILMIGMIS